MSQFTIDVEKWVEKAKASANQVVRDVTVELFSRIVMRSPVGNPDLWAANAIAATYNSEVSKFNAVLRADPTNLDKRGYLKRGKKLNDGMDIKAPAGYVGGRFRGSWRISIGAPPSDELDRIDADGDITISVEAAKLDNFTIGLPIFITNNLPYGQRLEYEGWSTQAPAGMVGISIAELPSIVDEVVRALR